MTISPYGTPESIREAYASGYIRRLRESRGMSLKEFAESVGVHQSSVGAWEHNRNRPSTRHMACIQETLDILHTMSPITDMRTLIEALIRRTGSAKELAFALSDRFGGKWESWERAVSRYQHQSSMAHFQPQTHIKFDQIETLAHTIGVPVTPIRFGEEHNARRTSVQDT